METRDGVFSIRNAKLGILRGSLVTKSKMRTRRLDKKIKTHDDLDVAKCRGRVSSARRPSVAVRWGKVE